MSRNQKLKVRVGVAALSSPLEVGADRAPGAAEELGRRLEAAGVEVVALGAIGTPAQAVAAGKRLAESHVDAAAFAVTSWFEDYLVLDLMEECRVPMLFRPLPGMETGALCGTQQLTAFLRAMEASSVSVFGPADDPGALAASLEFLQAAGLRARLRRCRIGMVGHHINGMTHTAPNEFGLKRILGPRVVWFDLPALLQRAEAMPESEARDRWAHLRGRAGRCEVSDEEGVDSMRVYGALREAVGTHDVQAVTVGCYPRLMGRVCLAASLLADEGIVMACEGDVHGALGQTLLQWLTGQPSHNTDWLDPVDAHSVVFTHCGSGSFSLAERPADVRLASVRLMGQGACALFTAKPGPVTLVNLTPHAEGYQCAVLEGEAVPTTLVFPGNPVQVRFRSPVAELIGRIDRAGLGHHWMIGYGHVAPVIRQWAALAGPGLRLLEW